MKKILFLTPELDLGNQLSGGKLKTSKLIKYLNEKYELKVLSLDTTDGFQRKSPTAITVLSSFLMLQPISVYRNNTKHFKSYISGIIDEYDLIIIDHFFMFQFVPSVAYQKTLYHAHNAEHLIWKRRSVHSTNILIKLLLKFESHRVRNYERNIVNNVIRVCASPNDINELSSISLNPDVFRITYHLGDDKVIEYDEIDYSQVKHKIVFLGGLDWAPNYDGVLWFLDNVWGEIKRKNPNAEFHIVGKCDHLQRESLQRGNVFVHGFVDDLGGILSDCRVFVCPLTYGSGMKVKNITAMYRGLPIVTTSVGAEGIEFENKINCFIEDDKGGFSEKVLSLLEDDHLCSQFSKSVRCLALEKYTWNKNLENFFGVIDEL